MKGNFANAGKLTGFILRRERFISTAWVLLLWVVVVGLVPGMYAMMAGEDRQVVAEMLENPSMVAMVGPSLTMINGAYGALYTNFMLVFTALTVGIMNIFLVVRHTRADEEQGRYEVVRSLPVGRLAHLGAAMLVAVIVNTMVAVTIGVGMFALGDASMGFNGAMLWGAALGGVGLVFAALAALFSQLSSNARGAMGYSFIALIAFYFLRAAGDMQGINAWNNAIDAGAVPAMHILSLISPLGLVMRTYAFAGDYWWPVFILLGTAIVITGAAFTLNVRRDIDRGLLPDRPGRRDGTRLFCAAHGKGLTFRLTRTIAVASIIGMFLLGASYASILDSVDEFVARNEMYQALMLHIAGIEIEAVEHAGAVARINAWVDGNLIRYTYNPEEIVEILTYAVAYAEFTVQDLFASAIMNMMALVSLVPVILIILRARSEEKAIRTELLLAASVSRVKYLAGFAVMAFVTVPLMQLVLALGLYGVGAAVVGPDILSLPLLLEASMVYVPALWLMGGVAVLLVGGIPKAAGFIWGYFVYSFLLMFIGRMGLIAPWVLYTSPFGFIPQLPVDDTNGWVPAALSAAALALTAAGLYLYRRRDINAVI